MTVPATESIAQNLATAPAYDPGLALIFASFGYNAPRNGMMVIVLLVCACKRPPTAWQYYAASL